MWFAVVWGGLRWFGMVCGGFGWFAVIRRTPKRIQGRVTRKTEITEITTEITEITLTITKITLKSREITLIWSGRIE